MLPGIIHTQCPCIETQQNKDHTRDTDHVTKGSVLECKKITAPIIRIVFDHQFYQIIRFVKTSIPSQLASLLILALS